jgi:site-specific DNA-methyltransferase (adenine-specific)
MMDAFRQGDIELRCGRWQDALVDVGRVDAVITDPPYSARTHSGRRTGKDLRVVGIPYAPLTGPGFARLAAYVAGACSGYAVVFCDHQARTRHAAALEGVGLYVFGPVRWVKPDAPPRMCGDGPTVSTEDILIARTSSAHRRHPGSRPGHYTHGTASSRSDGKAFPGAKPLGLMRALLRDYTLPGDLVCDPFSGSGTTARACQIEGRRFIGAEMDPETFALAVDRLRGWGPTEQRGQRNLFTGAT